MTTKTPNQIGSTPRAVNDGKITGTMMAIIPRPSMKHPRIAKTIITISRNANRDRSEEHTSELQSLMRISYAVFCLKQTNKHHNMNRTLHPVIYHYTEITNMYTIIN